MKNKVFSLQSEKLSSLNTIASTSWVKDLSVAPVYVDSVNGDDSNSGLTAAESVRTLTRGKEIATSHCHAESINIWLIVSGGNYTENFMRDHQRVYFQLKGNVSITGNIQLSRSSTFILTGPYTFTLTGDFIVTSGSIALLASDVTWVQTGNFISQFGSGIGFHCVSTTINGYIIAQYNSEIHTAADVGPITVNYSTAGTTSAVSATVNSKLYLGSNTNITYAGNGSAISVRTGSTAVTQSVSVTANGINDYAVSALYYAYIFINGKLTVSGTSCSGGIHCTLTSAVKIASGITFNDINTSTKNFIYLTTGSVITVDGAVSAYGASQARSIYLAGCSMLYFGGNTTITHKSATQSIVVCSDNSMFSIPSGLLTINSPNGCYSCFGLAHNSFGIINSLTVSGSASFSTVNATTGATFEVNTGGTISGSLSGAGKKYVIDTGGIVSVGGAGINRLPGANAGTVSNTITVKDTSNNNQVISKSYSYYG